MSEPTLIIIQRERRRRGRPIVEERRSSLSTWVPVSLADQAIQEACAREMSISEFVRVAVEQALKSPKPK